MAKKTRKRPDPAANAWPSFKVTSKQFIEIQSRYGLSTPEQIKNRIMWIHLKAITQNLFGNSAGNESQLFKYDREFKVCEIIELAREIKDGYTLEKKS